MAGVKLKGFDAVYSNLKTAMPDLNKGVARIMGKYGRKMVKYARTNHKFKTQTGQLERSITAKVDSKKWQLTFLIDKVRVYSNGYNYGAIQNNGFGQGFKASKLSPFKTTKASTKGLKYDHFMEKAWDEYVDDMTKELQKLLIKVLS